MLKILSIDDSRLVRMQVKKAFREYNVEILEAEDGVQGLEMARKHRPDLVFLDITMPIMSGVEMLPLLRADKEIGKTRVIMLSADLSRDMMLKMARLGSNDYIPKPFKHEQLVVKAKRFLGDALALQKIKPVNEPKKIRTYKIEEEHLIVTFPNLDPEQIDEITNQFPDRLIEAIQNRVEDVFLNLSSLDRGDIVLTTCMKYMIQNCNSNDMRCHIIAKKEVQADIREHHDTKHWNFYLPDEHLE